MENLLKKGAQGDGVRDLQTMLARIGHSVSVDGIFGAETEKALMTLQKKASLSPDGIFGPKTRTVLIEALAAVGRKEEMAAKSEAGAKADKTPAKKI